MPAPHVLILHGWQGNGPAHWQTWLAGRLRDRGATVRYPDLPEPDTPELARWLDALGAELDALVSPAGGETVVLCHSLGSLLWLHHAARMPATPVDRVLLVSPPSPALAVPELAEFLPAPLEQASLHAAAGSTRLVCAPDDPYCPEGAVFSYGLPLGLEFDEIAPGGHLNSDAGYGPWPAVEAWTLDGGAVPLSSNREG